MAKSPIPLSAARLKELLDYNPETGAFTWRVTLGARAQAGTTLYGANSHGYKVLRLDRQLYRAHRLAWLHFYGVWPSKGIDHINGVRGDNRIANLREANQSENMANDRRRSNNKSGFKGVSWAKSEGKWQAHIMVRYKSMCLGKFDTPEAAHEAYRAAALRHFGEFARLE